MRVLLTGATSQIGDCLIPLLVQAGYEIHALSRQSDAGPAEIRWFQGDLEHSGDLAPPAAGCQAIIHLAPIWTLPEHLPDLARAGVKRVLAFSSTSRFTKLASADSNERALMHRLIAAEESTTTQCQQLGMDWTLFRPTLIYGLGRDRNVADIERFIRRFGFFPVAGDAQGLRQPVHACDLAQACLEALNAPASRNQAYTLSGGEILSYSAMVQRIFQARGRHARILHLPLGPLRLGLRLMRLLPGFGHLSPEMADRMNRDQAYPHDQASRDFAYRPRSFSP